MKTKAPKGSRQQQIIEFIQETVQKKGYPPSVREIGAAVGLSSSSTVHAHLSSLVEQGLLKRDPDKPRAICLSDQNYNVHKSVTPVPVVGRVTAGQPILAMENIEDTYPLPTDLVGDGEVFMLVVQGDSMINAGILDGDYVLVSKVNSANNGDIVVALVDNDEATVKRFYKESGHIRLQPENDFMSPIIVDDAYILGKVIGVIRLY